MHQHIDWFGMSFTVPREWEIVRHSTDKNRGRLGFVDRWNQRAQLTWRHVERKPDIGRMFKDLRSRDRARFSDCRLSKTFKLNGWTGYYRATARESITHAGRYDKRGDRWIELVLVWPREHDQDQERLVLESFAAREYGTPETRAQWSAFGLSFSVPGEWELRGVLAGTIQKVFDFSHAGGTARIVKRSIPRAWEGGDIHKVLRGDSTGYDGEIRQCRHGKHTAVCFEGRERRMHPRWLWGKRYHRHDLLWECDANRALFQIGSIAHRGSEHAAASVALSCCGAVPAT